MAAGDIDIEAFSALVAAQVADPQRIAAVRATGLLDTPAESGFDRIAAMAARLLDTPFGFITVVDDERSFWKSCIGVDATDSADRQNRVEESFCQYVIGLDDAFLIDDTRLDPRTQNNPSIESMGVLAWAGVPLRSTGGDVLGTVCVVDTRTRSWSPQDAQLLFDLAEIAADEIVSVEIARAASQSEALLSMVLTRAPIGFALVDDELRYEIINQTLADINGIPVADHIGRSIGEILPDVAESVVPSLREVLDTGEPVMGVEVIGSTPSQPGVERTWSANYYRLDLDDAPRAGLFIEEITARVEARKRAVRLASITTGLARAETLEDIERVIVHEVAEYFGASVALVGHWDSDTAATTILASSGVKASMDVAALSIDDDAPYADAIRTGEMVIVSSPEDRAARYRSSVGAEITAEAAVPCVTGSGDFTGVMVIGWDRVIPADQFPLPQLRTVGSLIAGAFQRNRLNRHRQEVVTALAKTLVQEPPQPSGLDVSVRYRAVGDALGFGGDWYDAIPLSATRTALIIGDVAGHSPTAAAQMSQISTSIAQLLVSGIDPHRVFSETERSMHARSMITMATVCVVLVDSEHRTLTALSAGHLPPILLTPTGAAAPLDASLRPPLYSFFTESSPIDSVPYEAGSKLLMFTDGLIETRTSTIDRDVQRLIDSLHLNAGVPVDALLDKLLVDFTPSSGQFDDIALLGAHLH